MGSPGPSPEYAPVEEINRIDEITQTVILARNIIDVQAPELQLCKK